MALSKQTFVIAGLPVHVYSERHLTEHHGPVAVLFFLHGRTGTAKGIEWIVEDALKQVARKRKDTKHAVELMVVTFVRIVVAVVYICEVHSRSRAVSRTNATTETGS